jgi:predicted enzyme related to lactoylglutathione lyase
MNDHVRVRYIVDDVPATVDFYTRLLGFTAQPSPGPGFAILTRDGLDLLVNSPGGPGGAAQPAADGRLPEPGGWNRIQLQVADLEAEVKRLEVAGACFRSAIITGRGGSQILLDDPSGNPIELFQPATQ